MTIAERGVAQLEAEWETAPRWAGSQRTYTAEQVFRLRGTVAVAAACAPRRGPDCRRRLRR